MRVGILGMVKSGFVKIVNEKNMKNIWIINLLLCLIGCSKGKNEENSTIINHKFNNEVSRTMYTSDILLITKDLRIALTKYEGIFFSYKAPYVDTLNSVVTVDSLIYNENKNKVFVFLNVKYLFNDYTKVLNGKLTHLGPKILYDGFGYLAKRKGNSFICKQIGRQFVKYENLQDLKERQREYFFEELIELQNDGFRYNVNDSRMWDEPIWGKIE